MDGWMDIWMNGWMDEWMVGYPRIVVASNLFSNLSNLLKKN